MPDDHSAAIDAIAAATGLRIRSHRVIETGAANVIVEIDDAWMFRFPRGGVANDERRRKRLDFLTSFARHSPVAVPEPVYVTDDFVGYRKIAGTHLYPTRIERLRRDDRRRIARQLGEFLAALHHHEDALIDFDAGLLVMRHGYERVCPEPLARYLLPGERRTLDAKLEAILANPANFVEPTKIIHADLYFGNVLWDATERVVTGVIDWSEVGRGIPAMDFIGLADFNTRRNDQFLREILSWYGAGDGLFEQIKENAIIEVLNWFWFHQARHDRHGTARTLRRLKRILGN